VFDGASAPIAAVPVVLAISELLPHAASVAPASRAVAPAAMRPCVAPTTRGVLMARPGPPPSAVPLPGARRYRNSTP
jgi:hypothetical protein